MTVKSLSNTGSDTTTSSIPASSFNSAPIVMVEWVMAISGFPTSSATSQARLKFVIPLAAWVR